MASIASVTAAMSVRLGASDQAAGQAQRSVRHDDARRQEGYPAIQAHARAFPLLGGFIGQARGLVPRLVASGVDRERHQLLVAATSDLVQNVQER